MSVSLSLSRYEDLIGGVCRSPAAALTIGLVYPPQRPPPILRHALVSPYSCAEDTSKILHPFNANATEMDLIPLTHTISSFLHPHRTSSMLLYLHVLYQMTQPSSILGCRPGWCCSYASEHPRFRTPQDGTGSGVPRFFWMRVSCAEGWPSWLPLRSTHRARAIQDRDGGSLDVLTTQRTERAVQNEYLICVRATVPLASYIDQRIRPTVRPSIVRRQ